jgi:hypothetical protein
MPFRRVMSTAFACLACEALANASDHTAGTLASRAGVIGNEGFPCLHEKSRVPCRTRSAYELALETATAGPEAATAGRILATERIANPADRRRLAGSP